MLLKSRSRLVNALSVASVSLIVAGATFVTASAANAISPQTYPGVTEGAGSPNYTVSIDCNDPGFWGVNEGISFEMAPGGTVAVTTTGCSSNGEVMDISQYNNAAAEPGGYSVSGTPQTVPDIGVQIPTSFVVSANTLIEFQYLGDVFDLYIHETSEVISNPAGELGQTTEMMIPATNPLHANFSDPLNPADPNSGCNVANDGAEHVYQTYSFDVSAAGDYTFRFVQTNPLDGRLFWWGDSSFAMQDPFLAVYTDFDPANPSANVVGCNDDGGNSGVTSTGYFQRSLYSQFSSALPSGHYTLVLTTFGDSPVSSWTDGAQGGTFELWGPPGAFQPAQPELPRTGLNVPAWALPVGAGSIVLGSLALIGLARLKRRQL